MKPREKRYSNTSSLISSAGKTLLDYCCFALTTWNVGNVHLHKKCTLGCVHRWDPNLSWYSYWYPTVLILYGQEKSITSSFLLSSPSILGGREEGEAYTTTSIYFRPQRDTGQVPDRQVFRILVNSEPKFSQYKVGKYNLTSLYSMTEVRKLKISLLIDIKTEKGLTASQIHQSF